MIHWKKVLVAVLCAVVWGVAVGGCKNKSEQAQTNATVPQGEEKGPQGAEHGEGGSETGEPTGNAQPGY